MPTAMGYQFFVGHRLDGSQYHCFTTCCHIQILLRGSALRRSLIAESGLERDSLDKDNVGALRVQVIPERFECLLDV
jgi:hypothetical protein